MWTEKPIHGYYLYIYRDQSFSDTGRMPPKITRAVPNIAIPKTHIDHENPDRRVVTASEKCIVSTSSRSYNGVLCLPAPSTAFSKGGLFFIRPLVDKNWPGLYKVYVRKRDLMENENKSAKWHCGRHTLICKKILIKKTWLTMVYEWFLSVVSEKKI